MYYEYNRRSHKFSRAILKVKRHSDYYRLITLNRFICSDCAQAVELGVVSKPVISLCVLLMCIHTGQEGLCFDHPSHGLESDSQKFDEAALTQAIASDLLELRSEEHTSELQSLMRISYAVFCLKQKKT